MARLFNDAASESLRVESAPISAFPLTMSCWFNSDSTTVNQTLVSIGDSTDTTNMIRLAALGGVGGDPVRAQILATGPNNNADTTTGFSSNTWHHACGVFAANNDVSVYIDGGSKGTATTASGLSPSWNRTTVGVTADSTPGTYMSGSVAEVGVWDVALTDAEAAVLATGISPLSVRPGNLIFYAPLYRDEDNDWSGGLSLTPLNTPSISDHPRIFRPSAQILQFPSAAAASAAITGTITASIDESDIVTGGKTIIITLTGDTFKAAGTGPIGSTADTQALIDGFDAAASPANGWNNEVRDKALTSEVVRTSSTVATWTVAAQAGYDIASTETITGTIPTDVLVIGAGAITGVPTFTIDAVAAGGGLLLTNRSIANYGGMRQ